MDNKETKKETTQFLLNQNLLTCVFLFGEIIGYEKFSIKTNDLISGLILETLEEFSSFAVYIYAETFYDEDNYKEFQDTLTEFKENVIGKAKHEENVTFLFGNVLKIYSTHFDVESSLSGELEIRKTLNKEGLESWSTLDENILDCLFCFLNLFEEDLLVKYGGDLTNDIILMKLWNFIELYNNKDKDAEKYDEYIELFKQFSMDNLSNEEYIESIYYDLNEIKNEFKKINNT